MGVRPWSTVVFVSKPHRQPFRTSVGAHAKRDTGDSSVRGTGSSVLVTIPSAWHGTDGGWAGWSHGVSMRHIHTRRGAPRGILEGEVLRGAAGCCTGRKQGDLAPWDGPWPCVGQTVGMVTTPPTGYELLGGSNGCACGRRPCASAEPGRVCARAHTHGGAGSDL